MDIKVDDTHTLVFELENGNADFPFLLSDYHLLMLPATDGEVDWESGVGTGGYVLEEFKPGTTVKLSRNPNYFKGDERAHFEQVELINIADTTSRQNALITGEVDAIGRVDIKTAAHLANVEGVQVVETTGSQYSTILMDTRVAPFDNLDVRMAMKYAIDREQLLRTVLQGRGTVGNDHPIGPTYRYYAEDLEQRSYDPDKARFHLKQAGLERLEVSLQTSEAAWPAAAVDAAVLYTEQARAAGIEIEVVRKPSDGYWSNVWRHVPLCMGYIGGRPTEDWVFTAFYARDAHYNDTHWDNERFNPAPASRPFRVGRCETTGNLSRECNRCCEMMGGSSFRCSPTTLSLRRTGFRPVNTSAATGRWTTGAPLNGGPWVEALRMFGPAPAPPMFGCVFSW